MADARFSRRTSAASKHSTVLTTPLPALNRFDILLTEQISLVKNAQEGLRQSLALFRKACSKEEQESARLQVQSLMSRARELVTTLQVVVKIHRELIFAQRDLMEAKQAEKAHKSHYHRVHWLEQRLEKLLIARKRGRPAARGQRQARIRGDKSELLPYGFTCPERKFPIHTDILLKSNTSFGTPSVPSSPVPTSYSPQRDSILPSSTAHRSPSKASSPFPLPPLPQQPRSGSSMSSKRSAGKESTESDAWHSESEANWTIQLSNVNPMKDITQSQVLSSADEVTPLDTQRHTSSPSGIQSTTPSEPTYPQARETSDLSNRESVAQHTEKPSKTKKVNLNISETLYGFEPPRPAEVFGSSSWNTLSLAVNSSFLQSDMSDNQSALVCDVKNLEIDLDQVCNELLSLRRLVMTAAKAATVEGILLPEITSHTLQGFPTLPEDSLLVKLRKDVESPLEVCVEDSLVQMPPIDTSQTSRKVYGKKGDITFPRPTTIWSPTKSKLSHCTKHIRSHTVSQSSHTRRSPVRRLRSKSALTSDTQAKLDNIFDAERHREQRIKFLLEALDSPCVETRRSAAQALGCLPQADILQIQYQLTRLLEDRDTTVRYLALKSLLSLGEVSMRVKDITNKILSEGSPSVQYDLLQQINNLALKQPQQWSWCQVSLTSLLSSRFREVALLAAMLLSSCQLERDSCVTTLKIYLSSTNPTWRDQALHCLVKCWKHSSPEIVNAAVSQLQSCSNWKLRLSAVQLLNAIGKDILSMNRGIFDILVRRIANEPIETVKQAIGVLLADLDMEMRAQSFFLARLESADESVRAEAAIALRAFELRSPRIAQVLMDYFELDSSSYVRIQLAKTLAIVKYCSPVVLQQLADKCKGSGQVARECSAVLRILKKKFELVDEE